MSKDEQILLFFDMASEGLLFGEIIYQHIYQYIILNLVGKYIGKRGSLNQESW